MWVCVSSGNKIKSILSPHKERNTSKNRTEIETEKADTNLAINLMHHQIT